MYSFSSVNRVVDVENYNTTRISILTSNYALVRLHIILRFKFSFQIDALDLLVLFFVYLKFLHKLTSLLAVLVFGQRNYHDSIDCVNGHVICSDPKLEFLWFYLKRLVQINSKQGHIIFYILKALWDVEGIEDLHRALFIRVDGEVFTVIRNLNY